MMRLLIFTVTCCLSVNYALKYAIIVSYFNLDNFFLDTYRSSEVIRAGIPRQRRLLKIAYRGLPSSAFISSYWKRANRGSTNYICGQCLKDQMA